MVRFVVSSLVALAAVALTGCLAREEPRAIAAQPTALSASAQRGLDFATVRCAGCHAVAPGRGSPNPEAPPFEAVANQPGLTGATLQQFLADSHNYPAAMEFTLTRAAARDLADYIVTLKSPSYRPAI